MSFMSALPPNGSSDNTEIWYFSKVTDTNHAGYLWIITIMMFIVPMITCCMRLHVRWGCYERDDWVLATATLLSTCQHIAILIGLTQGLGMVISEMDLDQTSNVDKSLFAAEILFILTHTSSKLSLALFVRRLFKDNGRRRDVLICSFLITFAAAWGVTALITLLVKCSPFELLAGDDHCQGFLERWTAVTVLDVLNEIAIITVPSYMVSEILMTTSPKLIVMSAFAARMVPAAFSIIHLLSVMEYMDVTHIAPGYITPMIWIQLLLGASLISASLPSFKAFMRPFEKDMVPRDCTRIASHSKQTSAYGAYLMMGPDKSMDASRANVSPANTSWRTPARAGADISTGTLRLDPVYTCASIGTEPRTASLVGDSIGSCCSQDGIFRKDQWGVMRT